VSGFLDRFRRSHGALVCYLRENGPIAYALEIFERDPRERAGVLLATDLAWYWRAIAADGGVVRDWTHLTAWSLAALLADVGAEPSGGAASLVLMGIDGADATSEVSDARAASWMKGFSADAGGPVHAVVARPAPGGGELLFVAQHPPEPVRALLQAWGIDRDKAVRRAYPRLQSHTLEDMIRALR